MDKRTQVNKNVSTDEWYTPRELLMNLGHFDCDPCAAPADVRPYQTAPVCWTKDDDGLNKQWEGVVWLNPPYSKPLLRQFVEKLAKYGSGTTAVACHRTNRQFLCFEVNEEYYKKAIKRLQAEQAQLTLDF